MDYQEAIEVINNHERYVGVKYVNGVEEAYVTPYFEKALDTAISAMQELQEYKQKLNNAYGECDDLLRTIVDGFARHEGIEFGIPIKSRLLTDEDVDLWQGYKQLGTLEEVREAVEKYNECKNCGYKIHSERISELNSCNDCGLANICKNRPEYGQYCRINCYDWRCRNE